MTFTKALTKRGSQTTVPRVIVRTLCVVVGVLVACSATTPSAGAGTAGGAVFTPTVTCGASFVTYVVNSDQYSGSYARIWVYDSATARWITDGNWVDATAWSSFHTVDFTFQPGYYYFYINYAQWTETGWAYSGEYVANYDQVDGNGSHQYSSKCYVNS